MVAQQRALKSRATLEIIGGNPSGSGSLQATHKAKIRHIPKQTLIGYSPAEMIRGVDTMMPKLSAGEAGEDNDNGDDYKKYGSLRHRSGSGRSSVGSASRLYATQGRSGSISNSSISRTKSTELHSPVAGSSGSPITSTAPVLSLSFENDKSHSLRDEGRRSGSLGERENSFGDLGQLKKTGSSTSAENKRYSHVPASAAVKATTDELRRRGSVDDRALQSHSVRLFVANPDAD
jgi:hypothetical protein